jgi:hypothetical protein
MTSIDNINTNNNSYKITSLLGSDLSGIRTTFNAVIKTYKDAHNSNSTTDTIRTNVYGVLDNIKLTLSNPQRKYVNNAFVNLETTDKCYGNTTLINCPKLQEINAEITDKTIQILTKSQRTNVIMKQQQQIEQNEKDILSRQAQYTMAIERNKHRRRLIISVAILNTLLILFYYLMVKPTKFTEPSTSIPLSAPMPSAPLSSSYGNIGQPKPSSSMARA